MPLETPSQVQSTPLCWCVSSEVVRLSVRSGEDGCYARWRSLDGSLITRDSMEADDGLHGNGLLTAASNGDCKQVGRILAQPQCSGLIHYSDPQGWNALMIAADRGHVDTVSRSACHAHPALLASVGGAAVGPEGGCQCTVEHGSQCTAPVTV